MARDAPVLVRQEIEVRGLVQGVGFRPFVYRLAQELGLGGDVQNHSQGARVAVEGAATAIARFARRLVAELPAPGRIDSLHATDAPPRGERTFTIAASEVCDGEVALVLPDLALCDDCRRELLDPADRRHHYPFLNCTHCGPRFTIVRNVPYDRVNTTMAGFSLCPDCAREYADPADRRFHAQPNACPECGPRATVIGGDGEPIAAAAALLRAGKTVAVKGLGGYHLACDAGDEAAVARLRERKHREARPLAVMVGSLDQARELGHVSSAEAALLTSPAAPIVLLARRPDAPLAPSLAPGVTTVGVMLAYTPLHVLLLEAFGGPLVMTSGNLTNEPIAHLDDDAAARLGAIADAFLVHDRPIERRCDDSVVAVRRSAPLPLRRSRGYAPAPVQVAAKPAGPVVLAVGGHQKNAFCLLRGDQAFLSHHVGDLENDRALAAFETGIADFERLFDLRPALLAHDEHPDYLATGYALRRAEREGLPLVAVQHHHAHIASCLADNGLDEPVIGVAYDGTGLGPDGTIWGGEILVADRASYRRAGWLRPFRLAGGEAAVKQGWRVALALAQAAGVPPPSWPEVDAPRREFVTEMLAREVRCYRTTSAGRLFDGFSALLGLRAESHYEGEGAVALEGACDEREPGALPFALAETPDGLVMDWTPAVAEALAGGTAGELAMRFHRGLARVTAEACRAVADATGLDRVALSGGCLVNRVLFELLADSLDAVGLRVLRHRQVPPNDGGLALGQAVAARARAEDESYVFGRADAGDGGR